MTGSGLRIMPGYSIEDGLLDCFLLDRETLSTLTSAAARFLDLRGAAASRYFRRCRSISISAEPDQAVWADGEYVGRTPVTADVLARGAQCCRPLTDRPGSGCSIAASIASTRPSASPTSGSSATPGSRRSRPPCGSAGHRPTNATSTPLLALGITAVLDLRAERDAAASLLHPAWHRCRGSTGCPTRRCPDRTSSPTPSRGSGHGSRRARGPHPLRQGPRAIGHRARRLPHEDRGDVLRRRRGAAPLEATAGQARGPAPPGARVLDRRRKHAGRR